jgi:pimeloyl-ACP methyl ester carboxylesterase
MGPTTVSHARAKTSQDEAYHHRMIYRIHASQIVVLRLHYLEVVEQPAKYRRRGGIERRQPQADNCIQIAAREQEVSEAIARYQPQRVHSKSLDGLLKNVRLGADGKYRWHWDPRFLNRPREFERREKRLETCLRRLVLPTLLVRGGLSDVLSEEGVRHFLALCPHADYVNVTNAGHMVAGDRNDVFGTSVLEFLARTTLLAR